MNKIMKTLSLMFAVGAMLFSSGLHHEDDKVVKAAESVYKTALFGANYNSKGISSYTDSWTATNNGFTVCIENGNNNNTVSTNTTNKYPWEYIKFGSKNNASIGKISTIASLDVTISKVSVTVDKVTASNVNATYLYISSDSTFDSSDIKVEVSITTGIVEYIVPEINRTKNQYYQLVFDCAKSSNGIIQISKVEYYAAEEVAAKEYTSISVDETSKLEYYENEKFLANNLSILGHYTEDGEVKSEEIFGFTTDLADNTILNVVDHNNKEITITYEEKTVKCTLTVNPDILNSVKTSGTKRNFIVGDNFDIGDSAKIEANYASGVTTSLTLNDVEITLNGEIITLPYTLSIDDNGASIEFNYCNKSSVAYTISVAESVAPTVNGRWIEVTNVNYLEVNDRIIIAAKDDTKTYALGTEGDNNKKAIELENVTYISDYSKIQVLVLKKCVKDGQFAFSTDFGYLYAASSSSNQLKTTTSLDDTNINANSSWNITIVDGVTSIIASDSANRNKLFYNTSAKLFSCYSTFNDNSYKHVVIYKFVAISKNYETLLTSLIELDTCTDYNKAANLRDLYNSLSDEEKVLFDKETIIDNEKNTNKEVSVNALDKLMYMEYLTTENAKSTESSLNLFIGNNSNNMTLILIIGLLGLSSIAGYYFLNKKKYSR